MRIDVTRDHDHRFKAYSPDGENVELHLKVGYEPLYVEKVFGPLIFADLRIRADVGTCSWIIERECGYEQTPEGDGPIIWKRWVQIPGQLDRDFEINEEVCIDEDDVWPDWVRADAETILACINDNWPESQYPHEIDAKEKLVRLLEFLK